MRKPIFWFFCICPQIKTLPGKFKCVRPTVYLWTRTLSCLIFGWDSKVVSLNFSHIPKWNTGLPHQNLQKREAKSHVVAFSWPPTPAYEWGLGVREKNQELGENLFGKSRASHFTFCPCFIPLLPFHLPTWKGFFFLKAREKALRGSFAECELWNL